jgi:hypothetical protein
MSLVTGYCIKSLDREHEVTTRTERAPVVLDGAACIHLRSKGEAKTLVQASSLQARIFRPSVVFGDGDSFLTLFAKLPKDGSQVIG